MIPGENLLRKAQGLVRPTTLQYFRFSGRTLNAVGQDVSAYEAGVSITLNVQPVQRKQYRHMGLDYEKDYLMLWSSTDLRGLSRARSGDQIEYLGERYELLNKDNWTPIDGWGQILAIKVTNNT